MIGIEWGLGGTGQGDWVKRMYSWDRKGGGWLDGGHWEALHI